MAPALTAPVIAAAALLVLAAPAKLRRPDDTGRALRAAGLPGGRAVVRLMALAELVLGVVVLLAPSAVALALLALTYAGFAGFVGTALRRGWPLASCGCFGRPETPPTVVHAGLVGALAVAAAAAAVTTGAAALPDLATGGGQGAAVLLASVVATGLAWAALSLVPAVTAAARRPADRTTFRVVSA